MNTANRVYACNRPFSRSIDVVLESASSSGAEVARAQPIAFRVMTPEERFGVIDPEPTFRFTHEAAQQMMDELWRCGLRPSEGSGSAGAMAATERHLQDMRTLVFGTPAAMEGKS